MMAMIFTFHMIKWYTNKLTSRAKPSDVMYTDEKLKTLKLVQLLESPTKRREEVFKQAKHDILKLLIELHHQKITVVDISGPIIALPDDDDDRHCTRYELALYYVQGVSRLVKKKALTEHKREVEDARAKGKRLDSIPVFISPDERIRSRITTFGASKTSLLTLMLTVAFFFPHLFTKNKKLLSSYPPPPIVTENTQITQCETLLALPKKLWSDVLLVPILIDIRDGLEAWKNRKLVIEQNIQRMVKTMR